MSPILQEKVAALFANIAALNSRVDRYAEEVRELEKALLPISVEAWIKTDVIHRLGYARYGAAYRIVVETVEDGEAPFTKPFSECSRPVKVWAYETLPLLLDEIGKQIERLST